MTPEQVEWLCDLVSHSTSWDFVLDEFERRYGYRPKRQSAQAITSRHGVKLDSHVVKWSEHPEYDEWLRKNVEGRHADELIDMFEREFGVRLTVAKLKNREMKLGLRQNTVGGQFAPGEDGWNKGMKLTDYVKDPAKLANIRRTQYRRGIVPDNVKQVGDERVTRDGYIEVKVAPGKRQWKPKHRIVWEQTHGRKLEKGEDVMFADRDKTNFSPDNLVLVKRYQRLHINRYSVPYHDAESLRCACAAADLAHGIAKMELRPRTCPSCGKTYTPEYKHQRTCRSCLSLNVKATRDYGTGECAKCGATFRRLSARAKYCPACRKDGKEKQCDR